MSSKKDRIRETCLRCHAPLRVYDETEKIYCNDCKIIVESEEAGELKRLDE